MDFGDEDPRLGSIRGETWTPGARAGMGMAAEGHSALSGDGEHRRESENAAAAIATAAGGAPEVGDARTRSEFNIRATSAGMRPSNIPLPWWGEGDEQERKFPSLPTG